MLRQITVQNFAIFQSAAIDLYEDFTVITGESGSGKSVLINALSLISGARAYKEMIRKDCKYALVTAAFQLSINQKELINQVFTIDTNEDFLVITRKINQTQKSECRINQQLTTLNTISEVSSILFDIHGQYENQTLLNQEKHLYYLDLFSNKVINSILLDYKNELILYQKVINDLKSVAGSIEERERDKEIYSFQVNDIEQSNVLSQNWDEIKDRKKEMDDYEKININIQKTLQLLDDETNNISSLLFESIKHLEHCPEDELLLNAKASLNDSYYMIGESIKAINTYSTSLSFSEDEFEKINDIYHDISRITGKYGKTKDDVIKFHNDLLDKLNILNNYEKIHNEKLLKVKNHEKLLSKYASKLTLLRKEKALLFEKQIDNELHDLEMKNAKFSVQFKLIDKVNNLGYKYFGNTGNDELEFYISTNRGSTLLPLRRIASGGEMSRIMLAIKNILADNDQIETVIFDEIDAGISGEAAKSAALKMNNLAKNKQIICVTHAPLIIAMGNKHYVINKTSTDSETFANIIELSTHDERVHELAKIIEGDQVTKEGIAHANLLLLNN